MARSIVKLLALCALCLPLMGQDYGSGLAMVNAQPAAAPPSGAPLSALYFGSVPTHIEDNVIRYGPVSGSQSGYGVTEAEAAQLITTPGDFTGFRVELDRDIGSNGDDTEFTLLVDGSPTALTCRIDGTPAPNNIQCDTTGTVHVDPGQRVSIEIDSTVDAGGTPQGLPGWSLHFTGDNNDEQNILGHHEATVITVTYGPIFGHYTINNSAIRMGTLVALDGTLKNLRVELENCPGASKTRTYTVMIDESDTGLECVFTGATDCGDGATQQCDDTAESPVTISAGEMIVLHEENSGDPTPATTQVYSGLTFTPDTSGKFVFATLNFSAPSATVNSYLAVAGHRQWSTTATQREISTERAFTVTDMMVEWQTGPGVGENWAITLLDDENSTAVTCTVTGTDQNCGTDFSGSVAITTDSELTLEVAPSSASIDVNTGGFTAGWAGTVP